MDMPDSATYFQFQGEFVFFFEPFVGTWAKKHYQKVFVHRFDVVTQAHKFLGEYSLAGHYCNCVVGAGRYFIISFWPYEEEAMRTIWECLKIGRKMEKQLHKRQEEISELNNIISQQQKEIDRLKSVAEAARKEASIARKNAASEKEKANQARRQAREIKARWRKEQLNQERQRNERYRLRDPIHIYALSNGTGTVKADWTLVLDYHKGAHNIKLGECKDEAHALEITENDSVFLFDLIVPQNMKSIGVSLPVVPGKLCVDF